MDSAYRNLIFIVGIGAPVHLYKDYLESLQSFFCQSKIHVLEWWTQEDFGFSILSSHLQGSDNIIIAHSAGGVVALQALSHWPDKIKNIIMLDSHFSRNKTIFTDINMMINMMVPDGNLLNQQRVKNAYYPVLNNSTCFLQALEFAIDWVNSRFDQTCALFHKLPAHAALQIGFTNVHYHALSPEEEVLLTNFWSQSGVDVKCFPMGHFDLIDVNFAAIINRLIVNWLNG